MTTYRTKGELLDVLEVGAEALVFVDDRLVRGSIVTVDILWLCQEPHTLRELTDHCLAAFGPPPESTVDATTAAAVDALVHAGVLEELP